jgi:hypothetical protein
VLDVSYAVDVLVGKEPPPGSCSVGNDKAFTLVPTDCRYGQTHPLGKYPYGDNRIVNLVSILRITHKSLRVNHLMPIDNIYLGSREKAL